MQILGGVSAILKKSCIWQLIAGGGVQPPEDGPTVQQQGNQFVLLSNAIPPGNVSQDGGTFSYSGV